MVKWLAPAALAAFLAGTAQASPPPLQIVVSNSEGGRLLDFLGHVLGDIYNRVGATIEIKTYPAARSIEMANDGVTDAEALRGDGLERDYPNLIRVPVPILTLEYRAYSLDTPFTGTSWASLSGRRVCVNLGEKLVEQRTRDMPRELAHGLDAALKMLKAGRCDLVLSNQFVWLTADHYDLGTFCVGPAVMEEIPLYHYVHKRRSDLVPKLAAALRDLRKRGQLRRYLAEDPDQALLAAARARHECSRDPAPR